jgi:hypothetical protein
MYRPGFVVATAWLAAVVSSTPVVAQSTDTQQPHDHSQMTAAESGWRLAQDAVVYGLFNHQGGPRGGNAFVVPNWWMGMLTRGSGKHQFGLNAMFSLDAATVGTLGYGELFQVGEAVDGTPIVDRQHPHDLFMQLAASWRVALTPTTALVISGGPSGEPTLGPVAYMHRASAGGLALAPLGHHTFDSTHISFGVIAASVEHGKWTLEGSVFNGREPDEQRWDFDFAPLDSVAGRVWFRPAPGWEIQFSRGFLKQPEELIQGDAHRTTTSASWFRQTSNTMSAVTAGFGVNSAHGDQRRGGFAEFTVDRGKNEFFGRAELQQVETALLLTGEVGHDESPLVAPEAVAAITLGGARRILAWKRFDGAVAAQAVFYGVPDVLTPTHGSSPVSFQVMFRLRLSTGPMGRMWNMRMSQGPGMAMPGIP